MNIEYKKQFDRLVVCVFSLLFIVIGLLTMICYSAFAVYHSIIQENNESKQQLAKHGLSNNEPILTYWTLNHDRATDYLPYQSQGETYADYFYFDRDTENNNNYIVYRYNGDFRIKNLDNNLVYNNMSFSFYYYQATGEYYLYSCYLAGNGNSIYYLYAYNTTSRTDVICFNSVYAQTNQNVYDSIELGVIKYYFNIVFSSDNSYVHTFNSGSNNLPQYLMSYNRLQYGQIMYSSTDTQTDYLTIPMVFECNGLLYDNITILLRPCWYYYNSAGEIVSNSDVFPSGQGIPYVCSYVLFGYYGKTLSWNYDTNIAGLLTSVDNGSLAMFLGYNGYSYHTGSTPADNFYAPNYMLVQGLQVNNDYQTIHIKEVDTVPFFNTTGTNLKPYNNISIRDILVSYFNFYGDVNGYNGSYYEVGLGSVFTLLSNAFQSLIPLMAIQIIPGITIGLLIMLPLIVTIILVILKLVKK